MKNEQDQPVFQNAAQAQAYAVYVECNQKRETVNQKLSEIFDSSMSDLTFLEILNNLGADENSVIIDLGANLGQQIDSSLSVGSVVHAFEPHPKLFKYLERKYRDNKSVTLKKEAAGVENCNLRFFFKGEESDINGGASLLPWKMLGGHVEERLKKDTSAPHATVKSTDISEYILNLEKNIKILKIDVEGFEYAILKKLIETRAINRVEYILFEDHSDSFLHVPWFNIALEALSLFEENNLLENNSLPKVFMWQGVPTADASLASEIEDLFERDKNEA
tara:strand:+ start:3532 stop:4365 length:834 start_codon:yes stop_codon:yes gene_type:complete